jgi:SAM-dependent methyltransferase
MDPRSLLSIPRIYSAFRRLIGRNSARSTYARDHLRVQAGQRVLDIGCGTGDILEYLPDVDYTGYDISQDYIDRAKRRFGHRGKFHCHPVGAELDIPKGAFDIVIAHGVLHHIDDLDAQILFQVAKGALKPGGRLVTFDGCFTDDQSILSRFVVSRDRGQHVRDAAAYEQLARTQFSEVSVFIRHDLIRIPYTHIIMECTA